MGPASNLRPRSQFPFSYFDPLENSIDTLVNQQGKRYRKRRCKGDSRCRRRRLKWSDPLPSIFNATLSAVHIFNTSRVRNYSWPQLAEDNDVLLSIFVQPAVPDVSLKKIGINFDLGETEDGVFSIVRHLKSSPEAVNIFKTIPPLEAYFATLEGNERKENFRHLCGLYLNIWKEDCPFYLASTLQYDGGKPQVCVKASQLVKEGEDIQGLVAFGAVLSNKTVKDLEEKGKDFSLLQNDNMIEIDLGPFQFVNHDCQPNARIRWMDSGSAGIEALRDINPHEEILVKYGRNYFGPGNAECRCLTCGK